MTDTSHRRLAVSIVNYGTSELVLEALPALIAELRGLAACHVFIVDNASPDGDGAKLNEGLQRGLLAEAEAAGVPVTLLMSPVNGGFAAGNNVAFAAIRKLDWTPDAVLLLNPDAEVCPGSMAEMLRVMDSRADIGFVGPRLVNPDGSSWVAAFNFPSFGTEVFGALGVDLLARHFRTTIPDSQVPVRADWVTGTALMIRRDCFQALGDMDDGYFLYYEEVDYMLQGARLGWQSWHAPDAKVRHIGGAATGVVAKKVRRGRMPAYWFQAWSRYFSKNHGPAYARATAALKLAALSLGDLQRRLRGREVSHPERYYRDFAARAVLGRLTPPPASTLAATPGGRPRVRPVAAE